MCTAVEPITEPTCHWTIQTSHLQFCHSAFRHLVCLLSLHGDNSNSVMAGEVTVRYDVRASTVALRQALVIAFPPVD